MIIKSILDTDLYKFTTSYAYMKLFPQARGTFEFIDRDNTEYPEDFIERLYLELGSLGMLHLAKDEQEYMNNNCRFIPPVYWEWLSSFKFNSGKIQASLDENGHLHIKVTDYLYKVTLYEVPILAIVSELRSRIFDNNCDLADVIKRLSPKIKLSNVAGIKFSEFGTRRRFSYNVQDIVVSTIKEGSIYCTGTSNCHLAMKYDMPMMGTHPHEWFMFHGAMYGYRQANYMALENWVNVYDGDLGIALSDTYTSYTFMKNLSRKQAKLFDGVRCDSGDEYKFINDMISRYKGLVMSTDNQTEYQLGFWTIHGDVGDFDPIQGLWKTEVYGLANWLLKFHYPEVYFDSSVEELREVTDIMYALRESIALTPTDGLGISNSDLEQIGAKDYATVDDILSRFIPFKEYRQKHGEPLHPHDEMAESDCWSQLCARHGEDVVNKVWDRHLASEFKRKKAPIYISRKLYE
jgi:nicotinate phosphoribosyltransferase